MISRTKQAPNINRFKSQSALLANIRLVPSQFQLGLSVADFFANSPDGAVKQAPAVFTLSQWVSDCAMRLDLLKGEATPHAPDHFQLLQLWDDAIGESVPDIPAQERFALAQRGRETARFLGQWALDSGAVPERGIWRRFCAWEKAVRDDMQRLHWHSNESGMLRLVGHLQADDLPGGILPDRILLAGFVELTALESQLIAALRNAGVRVMVEEPPVHNSHCATRQCFASVEQEISAAACWAQQEVAQGRRRVAVIVNGLDSVADQVRLIFENQLQPGTVLALHDPDEAPFRISTGPPLAGTPLVSDALMLLDLAVAGTQAIHEFPRISRCLLSPNWSGGRAERFARARLELSLRKAGYYRWSLSRVAKRAAASGQVKNLRKLIACLNSLGAENRALHPARQLLKWLIDWGWPGDSPCTGAAARAQMRVVAILESLSRHSFNSSEDCLLRLKRACSHEAAPGPGGVFSPIQVMTPGEAFGLGFDAAWAMNFTMENWPGRPLVSPFLPADLRRQIPRATEDGALEYAQRLTGAVRACAPRVRFSWCNRLDDLPLSVSPLIADLPEIVADAVPRSTLWRALAPAAEQIRGYRGHPWLFSSGPAQGRALETGLETGANQPLRGAVTLLNYQSACPLAAYLVFRLGARMQPEPTPFSDAAYRGELVHAALEQLYRACRGSRRRPDVTGIARAVNAALKHCLAPKHLSPAEMIALRQTLAELLEAWLDFEQRWTGRQVEKLEWRKTLEFRGFSVDVRIDRVDRTGDGRAFLLDYKTGSSGTLPAWAEARPGDLQLPFYAVLMADAGGLKPAGIAIALVRLNEMKFIGLSDDDASLTAGISGFERPSGKLAKQFGGWEEALEQWRVSLAQLLAEVRAGDCRHQLFRPAALKYADLDILLRSEEGRRWGLEREDHDRC